MAQPDLDYLAPDLQIYGKATQACDIFSLGLVIQAIFNGGVSLLDAGRSSQQYHRKVEELPVNLPKALTQLPCELAELVEKMLDREPRHRPSAQLLSMNKYFQDPLLLALEGLVTCEAKTVEQKKEFFSLLMQTMMREQFPKNILFKRVCPLVAENLQLTADLTPYVLPCLLRAVMQVGPEEFRQHLCEHTLGVLRRPKTAQVTLVLVEHSDVLVEKLDDSQVKGDLLPLVFTTLDSNSSSGQEAALSSFVVLQDHIDDATLRKLILPKTKALFQKNKSIAMKVGVLSCLERLMDRLDKMAILEDLLPFLLEIGFSDPDIYMAVLNIYKRMLSDKRFGLSYNLIATKVLPHLIPYTVNPNLRRDDFRVAMETLNEMWNRLESGRSAQMRLEDAEGADSTDEFGNLIRPPLITMQKPSFDADAASLHSSASAADLPVQHQQQQQRRRSSSGLQQQLQQQRAEAASGKLSEAKSVRSNPGPDHHQKQQQQQQPQQQNQQQQHLRSFAGFVSGGGSGSGRMCKTGSSPTFNLRTAPRKGSATDIYGAGGGTDEANRSFTLSIPSVQARRHSLTATAAAGVPTSSGVASGSFITPPSSRVSSRRPSAQSFLAEKLGTSPIRRSSFNALSDTVMNLFSGAGGSKFS
ncbi:hypothetical protein BOX15_Mlig028795g1 [Macrostomum lignano]|uniref:Protein kinase domain-containing protein n=1 Tax=Macrostomum lignano TaxID=282301 RepID=A0A267G1M1_9PLAT|nr:hypothetical protein BOX15_Mlig028795g1 [Macrostomum lignano]